MDNSSGTTDERLKKILDLVEEYEKAKAFVAPRDSRRVPYAGRRFDHQEIRAGVEAVIEGWLTWGSRGTRFEEALGKTVGVRHVSGVNSGSSANLVAFSALMSPTLKDPIRPGDEILTVAASFPTTVNPIIQSGCVPVFVDIEMETYVAQIDQLASAVSDRTRAIVMAHTLGVPFDLDAVRELCERKNLYLIEDNCDALGSLYKGKMTGSFGDLSTLSFYPAHHITMGEGGAVLTNDPLLSRAVKSIRDWGRDCWCESGVDNTCKKRFGWKLGELPQGYDHKYIYSHLGYNLKATEVQAAIGLVQLGKLAEFTQARRRNWKRLRAGLAPLEEFLILPRATEGSDPSWFGFMVTLKECSPVDRRDLVRFLEDHGIQTRPLFAGNLLRHPAYRTVPHRVIGNLPETDAVMERGFFVGVYPGLGDAQIDHVIEQFHAAFSKA